MPLTVTIDSEHVVARLREMGGAVRIALRRAVTEEAIRVEARVREKLAGEVLKERSHALHDSIHTTIDDTATRVIAKVGTDREYAAIHEYGFQGVEQVREHTRRISVAFGRPIDPVEVTVRAHARQMNMPERSFLRSTLTEMRPEIVARLEEAVAQAAATP